ANRPDVPPVRADGGLLVEERWVDLAGGGRGGAGGGGGRAAPRARLGCGDPGPPVARPGAGRGGGVLAPAPRGAGLGGGWPAARLVVPSPAPHPQTGGLSAGRCRPRRTGPPGRAGRFGVPFTAGRG